MLIYDKLDKLAEELQIPTEMHPYLHINSRQAWVETVVQLIEGNHLADKSKKTIRILGENWEELLCRRYANLN